MSADPTGGDDVVTETPPDDSEALPPGSDPHLLLYRSLRDEIRPRTSEHHRSLLSGLSVIGVIIAYALLSGEFVFLAVVPVVVGFLAVQSVQYLNNLSLSPGI